MNKPVWEYLVILCESGDGSTQDAMNVAGNQGFELSAVTSHDWVDERRQEIHHVETLYFKRLVTE